LHAFSNNGFWTALAALEEIRSRDTRLFAAFSGIVIDSAPGIPERNTLRFTMRYMPRAMMPGLLSAMGLAPRLEHPLLTPLMASLTGLATVAFPSRFRAMEESLGRMRLVLRDKRALFIWGDADELVPHTLVEAFAASCEASGVHVERTFFPGSAHVRHFMTHRAAYLEAASRFVASI
jgi:pimeloyl-ACP methyl ester carboxylesterase